MKINNNKKTIMIVKQENIKYDYKTVENVVDSLVYSTQISHK